MKLLTTILALCLCGCAGQRTPEQEAAHQARLDRFASVLGKFAQGIGNGLGQSAANSLRDLEGLSK